MEATRTPLDTGRCSRTALVLLAGAAAAGLVHAAFSAYWALGGDWLLGTVGEWAVDYVRREPTTSALMLLTVAAVKSLIAVGPLLLCQHQPKKRRLLKLSAASCAVVLMIYGAVNSVAAWLVLGGALNTDAPIDRDAMIGHGFLWDPLFLAWGLFLAAGLYDHFRAARRAGERASFRGTAR